MIRMVISTFYKMLEVSYWKGFEEGAITAAVVICVLLLVSRK